MRDLTSELNSFIKQRGQALKLDDFDRDLLLAKGAPSGLHDVKAVRTLQKMSGTSMDDLKSLFNTWVDVFIRQQRERKETMAHLYDFVG